METLSVCIIAKNEEKFLPDCLDSIKTVANEIILVDTGSSDRTVEIAKSYNCKVFNFPWQNDFSKARNFALEKAQSDWILSIDADERLLNPDALSSKLKKVKKNIGGFLINVVSEATRADGKFDVYSTSLLRLFRSQPKIRFYGIIHEQIIDPIQELNLKIENSDIQFLHLGYTHDLEQMKKKQLRNLELLDLAIKNNEKDINSYYQRAKTYLALKDLSKAERDIAIAIELASDNSTIKPQALNYGAIISYQQGDYQKAIQRATQSLKIVPIQSFANFILGETYTALRKYEEALNFYQKMYAAQLSPSLMSQIIGDYNLPIEQLYFRLGKSYIGLNQHKLAKSEFEKGLAANQNDSSCMVGLANVFYISKNYKDALELLEKARALEPNRPEIKGFINQVRQTMKSDTAFADKFTDKAEESELKISQKNVEKITRNDGKKDLLSLSMIVKNEEEMLPGCLESVKDIVDEIVIVDTGSSDKTKEIALSYGAKVYDFVWNKDFAAARNESLKRCTCDWLIYLDADERIEKESSKKIRQLLLNAPYHVAGYICTIESEHLQLTGSTEMHRGGYPRVFRNLGFPTIRFEGRVHEQIAPSIFEAGKSIDFSDIIIEHLGYNKSREEMDKKIRRNYDLLMQHIQEEPLNAYAWYQLGQTLGNMRLYKEAENAIRFAIELGGMTPSVFASASSTLSQIVGNQGQYEEALFWAEKSLEQAPNQVYALNLKAYSLMHLNRFDEAELLFNEVLRRLRTNKGVPQSGFDIVLDEDIIFTGLNEIKKRRAEI